MGYSQILLDLCLLTVIQEDFCVIGKFSELSYNTKTLREDRTAAEWNYVAHATRRRRRIPRCRILC